MLTEKKKTQRKVREEVEQRQQRKELIGVHSTDILQAPESIVFYCKTQGKILLSGLHAIGNFPLRTNSDMILEIQDLNTFKN